MRGGGSKLPDYLQVLGDALLEALCAGSEQCVQTLMDQGADITEISVQRAGLRGRRHEKRKEQEEHEKRKEQVEHEKRKEQVEHEKRKEQVEHEKRKKQEEHEKRKEQVEHCRQVERCRQVLQWKILLRSCDDSPAAAHFVQLLDEIKDTFKQKVSGGLSMCALPPPTSRQRPLPPSRRSPRCAIACGAESRQQRRVDAPTTMLTTTTTTTIKTTTTMMTTVVLGVGAAA